jgi:hypothetical protein
MTSHSAAEMEGLVLMDTDYSCNLSHM